MKNDGPIGSKGTTSLDRRLPIRDLVTLYQSRIREIIRRSGVEHPEEVFDTICLMTLRELPADLDNRRAGYWITSKAHAHLEAEILRSATHQHQGHVPELSGAKPAELRRREEGRLVRERLTELCFIDGEEQRLINLRFNRVLNNLEIAFLTNRSTNDIAHKVRTALRKLKQ